MYEGSFLGGVATEPTHQASLQRHGETGHGWPVVRRVGVGAHAARVVQSTDPIGDPFGHALDAVGETDRNRLTAAEPVPHTSDVVCSICDELDDVGSTRRPTLRCWAQERSDRNG